MCVYSAYVNTDTQRNTDNEVWLHASAPSNASLPRALTTGPDSTPLQQPLHGREVKAGRHSVPINTGIYQPNSSPSFRGAGASRPLGTVGPTPGLPAGGWQEAAHTGPSTAFRGTHCHPAPPRRPYSGPRLTREGRTHSAQNGHPTLYTRQSTLRLCKGRTCLSEVCVFVGFPGAQD